MLLRGISENNLTVNLNFIMKKILIVHAHPEPKSFNSSLKNIAVEFFESKGAEVKVSDLYTMGFDPVGGKHDFTKLENESFFKYQMEQVHAFQHDLFEASLKKEMDKLEWCDTLVFNFPLWWFGLPAILKGWADRVFAMGFVYGAGKGVYDNGIYKHKKAFSCITTGGPQVAYGKNGKNGPLDMILYPIQHGMYQFLGMEALEPFICFSPAKISDEERQEELRKYKNYLQNIYLKSVA